MGGKTLPVGRQELPEAGKALGPASLPDQRKSLSFRYLENRRGWHATGNDLAVRPLGEQEMKRTLWPALVALAVLTCAGSSATATSRIKDLANIEGIRQNQLIGYGLVVGLNGTGDTLNNIPFTKQSLQAMLERMGVNIRGATIRTGNVAAVMVTGNLP